ncbi:hypothetical protein A2V71_03435 [Candidatus Berkelbacteria bacterium RBG_13_40_8]|uniref:Uncharacterized protein n=1 Tax=Candidatus Berkelbacteria bacterium RBG_13_40_8 TaxID=1797467 RepID=A0A1F5DQR9_9BACT|nr:MAG: hypothetical protein A2V71_03435 [Candidatus Berkelbacteria bacterium RBG_13_40_8]
MAVATNVKKQMTNEEYIKRIAQIGKDRAIILSKKEVIDRPSSCKIPEKYCGITCVKCWPR